MCLLFSLPKWLGRLLPSSVSPFLRHRDPRFSSVFAKHIDGPHCTQSYSNSLHLEFLYSNMNAQLTPLHIQGRVGQILESTLGSVISTGTYAWNTWVMANETSDAQLYPVLSFGAPSPVKVVLIEVIAGGYSHLVIRGTPSSSWEPGASPLERHRSHSGNMSSVRVNVPRHLRQVQYCVSP